MKRLLIVEDKESLALMLKETVESEGLEADVVANGNDAMRRLAEGRRYFAVLTDLRLPGADGIAVLKQARESDPDCPVIVMTAFATIENAVEAMKIGAYDFVQKPVDVDHLLLLLRRCRENRELRYENLLLKEEYQRRHGLPAIVGESGRIVEVSREIQKVAPTDSTVLLQGESGTGKELFARAIHQLSPRRDRPFVAINCAAIPENLLEAELFGFERGAFTGATQSKPGQLEQAGGGTLFLDEVGEMSLPAQAKFLRVLQEKEFQRLGGTRVLRTDARIVAATNRDLSKAIALGTFREDLYYRLNVFAINLPPLRARPDDVLPLSEAFLAEFGASLGRPPAGISRDARAMLMACEWPGNVRELRNILERAAILCDGGLITAEHLNLKSGVREVRGVREVQAVQGVQGVQEVQRVQGVQEVQRVQEVQGVQDLASVEKSMIVRALEKHRFNKSKAAKELGLTRAQLYVRMNRHGLE